MKNFKLFNMKDYSGYINKKDITNIEHLVSVIGSQNVLSTDEGRVGIRKGYTVFGSEDSTLEPITAEHVWKTARGVEIMLRGRNDDTDYGTLEFYATDYGATFTELINGVGSGKFNFTTIWDTTEYQDILLFVVGDSSIYYWSGGLTTFASATSNTITKEGAESWKTSGFLLSSSRQVIIEGVTYNYTGGETTTTLTGVTPDPTTAGHTVGAISIQKVRQSPATPTSGFNNSLIATYRNQVFVGDLKRRDIFVSAVGDYTDYTPPTVPRLVGESTVLTLNEAPTAFIEQEDNIYLSTFNQWYNVKITLSGDLQSEDLQIQLLKSSPLGGAINQKSVFKIKNDILFISNEPTINSLGRVESIDTPESSDLSDPIKLELESYTLTNCSGKFFQNFAYFNFPSESKTLVYNIKSGFWEAPQILPVSVMSIFNGELYGHSETMVETYKLFDGLNDRGNAINAILKFAYSSYGNPAHKKGFTEWYTDGYISTITNLNLKVIYDYKGSNGTRNYEILGNNPNIIFSPAITGSLGNSPLGSNPLGSTTKITDILQKFRTIEIGIKSNFYELQIEYSSNDLDQQWFILHQGGTITLSKEDNSSIKK